MSIPTPTTPRPNAYQLASAITDMVTRYGEAERRRAYLVEGSMHHAVERAEMDRWGRACRRRYRAVQRLINALRDAR